jgi:hypothetical protein
MVWEDVESIRAFAGERWQEAVVDPDEEHLPRGHLDRQLRGSPDIRLGIAPWGG